MTQSIDLPEMQDLRLCAKIDSDRNGMTSEEKCISKNELNLSFNQIENVFEFKDTDSHQICWDCLYVNMQTLLWKYNDSS